MPPQRRSGRGSRRRALRVLFQASELSATIRGILLADVLAHLLQFEPDRGDRVAASPEVFAREVPLLSGKPCDGNRALPFQKTDHRSDWMLRRNRDAHVHVIRHQWPPPIRPLLLLPRPWKNGPSCRRIFPKIAFRRRLGTNTTWYL